MYWASQGWSSQLAIRWPRDATAIYMYAGLESASQLLAQGCICHLYVCWPRVSQPITGLGMQYSASHMPVQGWSIHLAICRPRARRVSWLLVQGWTSKPAVNLPKDRKAIYKCSVGHIMANTMAQSTSHTLGQGQGGFQGQKCENKPLPEPEPNLIPYFISSLILALLGYHNSFRA